MNSNLNPDAELRMEAMILYHSIQLSALEDLMTKVGDVVLRTSKSKNTAEYLRNHRELNIRNIPRHLADTDPTRASRLLEMLEKMNRGEQP
jgi:hypothetical protein